MFKKSNLCERGKVGIGDQQKRRRRKGINRSDFIRSASKTGPGARRNRKKTLPY